MNFFKDFIKAEKEERKNYPIEKIILTTNIGNLKDLKERINEKNIIGKILEVEGDCYTPLGYAIKVENLTSVEYFLEIDPLFYHRGNFNLEKECKNLKNINIIKLLVEKGVDFNVFHYPIKKHELPGYLNLKYSNDDMRDATIGFYSQILLNNEMNYKFEFLQELDAVGIRSSHKDFFTPAEACMIGNNYISVIKKVLENSSEPPEELFHLFLDTDKSDQVEIIGLIKYFVDERGIILEKSKPMSERLSLILRIFNSYSKNSEIMFEAIQRMKSFDGFEKQICSVLNEKQIAALKGFNVPNEIRFFTLKNYNDILNCLKNLKKLDRTVLDHLVFNDFRLKEKITLIDTFIQMGGDINVMYEPAPSDSSNVNLLYALAYGEIKKREGLIQHLLEKGAKIQCNGYSALLPAIHNYNLFLIKLLLDAGADPNYQDTTENLIIEGLFSWNTHVFTPHERQEVINLLLTAGLEIDKIYSFKNGEYSVLERLFLIKNTEESLTYLLNNNIGDFSKGEIPLLSLLSKTFTLENKIKIIDLNPNYRFYDQEHDTNLSLLDINMVYNVPEGESLINYILEKHPKVKLSYIEKKCYLPTKSLNFSTYEKLMTDNSHLIKKRYQFNNPDDIRRFNMSTMFVKSMNYIDMYKKGGKKIDEIVSILDLYVSLGDDINIRSVGDNSSSILQPISFIMTETNQIELKIFDCLYRNGFDVERLEGRHNETPLLELHRWNIIDYNPIAEDVYVSILDFFWEKAPFDLSIRSGVEDNLLLAYSKACSAKVVEWILQKGDNINAIGGFDNSPALHKAISNHDIISPMVRAQTVEVLIKYGADIEQFCNADHFTPLMSAVYYGAKECVKVLLKAGANINALCGQGLTIPQLAVVSNRSYDAPTPANFQSIQSNILKILVEHGAELNYPSLKNSSLTTNESPPLHWAVLKNKKEIFETLIQLGADINLQNIHGDTPLKMAVSYGETYFIERLLKLNSDIEVVNKRGQNVLDSCIFRANEDEGILLYKHFRGLGLQVVNQKDGFNLLQDASSRMMTSFLDILSKDMDINSSDDYGYTPLLWALSSDIECTIHERLVCVNKIISLGGNVESTDNQGKTPLIWAAYLKSTEIVDSLIRSGASIELSISAALEFNMDEDVLEVLTELKKYTNSNNKLFS